MSASETDWIDRTGQPEHTIPPRMLRWHLYGAGFEHLGRNGRPEEVEVPHYGPDELLVRQDACGLCFSDVKVIAQGSKHPRLSGRDLSREPVTLGHEVACTVVGVGANLSGRFRPGERYVIQPDIYSGGRNSSYGYAIPGGLAEYSVIPQAVIEGDEGCYLLPVRDSTGYVEAALTEPWACVVAAYVQSHRDGILNGGEMLVIGSPAAAQRQYDWSGLITPDRRPNHIIAWCLEGPPRAELAALATTLQVPVMPALDRDWNKIAESGGFDDIVLLGNVSAEQVEAAAHLLNHHGILNRVSDRPLKRKVALDIGRIHYNWHHTLGTDTNRPADAYIERRDAELRPGGVTWIVGAGGPMGQMHVQRAVQLPCPPRRIVASDLDAGRLRSVQARFQTLARLRGIELVTLNPSEMNPTAYRTELNRWADGVGYDDIVSLAPSVEATEQAADYLAPGGWLNLFAGVARGTLARLNLNRVVSQRCRFLGSTGSSLADMRATLERVERGELAASDSLAAIGGMEAAGDGLRAVKEGRFPGKTLIFPLIRDLPLTPLSELKTRLPSVSVCLRDGQFWTQEAEAELLRLKLTQPAPPIRR